MKLQLNREYAIRHLGVAALFAALGGWFLYDGAVVYPAREEAYFAETLHTQKQRAIDRQFQFAGLCALAALVIAARVARSWRQTLEWDDAQMNGSLTGGHPLPFAGIARLDDRRWASKGILVVHAQDGRAVTLDTWHHLGARELGEALLTRTKDAPQAAKGEAKG